MKHWQLQDPLHKILEQHLFKGNIDGDHGQDFLNAVIADYLLYLDTQGMMVMGTMREIFVEDLKEEIKELTVMKTYGTMKIEPKATLPALSSPKMSRKLI